MNYCIYDVQNGRIANSIKTPIVDSDVANKKYVDDNVVTGGFDQSLNSTDNVTFNEIRVSTQPTTDTEVATKKYVDDAVSVSNIHGWGNYRDGETTPATQVIDTTPQKLSIDSAGGTSEESYLPVEIRGIGSLWDPVNDKITPIKVGDSYSMRLDMTIVAESGNPNEMVVQLDIGGGPTPTIPIIDRYIVTGKTPPYAISIGMPIFSLITFNTNGGQIFLSTNTGTVTIGSRGIFICRLSSPE